MFYHYKAVILYRHTSRDVVGLVPDHHSKASIVIKWVVIVLLMECLAFILQKMQHRWSTIKWGVPVYAELEHLWWGLVCDTFIDLKKSFDYWNLLFEHIFILACVTLISDFSLGSSGQQDSLGADVSSMPGGQKDVVNSVPKNWGTWIEWGSKWGGVLWGPTLEGML